MKALINKSHRGTASILTESTSIRLRMARRYITSYYGSLRARPMFHNIHTYCMFIGHARSGHSIIGALLDAHPDIILADEVDALQYISAGFNRNQIYHLILARSLKQLKKGRTKRGRSGATYSYLVADQWQGRFNTLQVIGDSKAGKSTQRLAQSLELLASLQQIMGTVDVKLIHVIRNPFDNISTMVLRGGRTFENAIESYFSNCKTLDNIRKQSPTSAMFTIRYEDFITYPEKSLHDICCFLGVDASADYLKACASILYTSPPRSRHNVPWNNHLIKLVTHNLDEFDFLRGYSYES